MLTNCCLFFFLRNAQLALCSVQLGLTYRNFGLCFYRCAFFFVGGNHFRKFSHPYSVKGVVFVQCMKRRLIQTCDGDCFQKKTVFGQFHRKLFRHLAAVFAAVVLQAVHRIFGGNRHQRVHEFAFKRVAEVRCTKGFSAQCLSGCRNPFDVRCNPHVKFSSKIYAQSVRSDDRLWAKPSNFKF